MWVRGLKQLRFADEQVHAPGRTPCGFQKSYIETRRTIGERISREAFGNQRNEYGKLIVSQVATQLQEECGKKDFKL